MPVTTAGALVFPLLLIEQHNSFSFWNREPNKSQELLKDLALSLFYVQNACFSFPNSGTAHHFQRINDFRLSNFITRNRSAAKISQVLCSIVHILSFLAFQPLHHRFQAFFNLPYWLPGQFVSIISIHLADYWLPGQCPGCRWTKSKWRRRTRRRWNNSFWDTVSDLMHNWVPQRPDFKSALRVIKMVLNTQWYQYLWLTMWFHAKKSKETLKNSKSLILQCKFGSRAQKWPKIVKKTDH